MSKGTNPAVVFWGHWIKPCAFLHVTRLGCIVSLGKQTPPHWEKLQPYLDVAVHGQGEAHGILTTAVNADAGRWDHCRGIQQEEPA